MPSSLQLFLQHLPHTNYSNRKRDYMCVCVFGILLPVIRKWTERARNMRLIRVFTCHWFATKTHTNKQNILRPRSHPQLVPPSVNSLKPWHATHSWNFYVQFDLCAALFVVVVLVYYVMNICKGICQAPCTSCPIPCVCHIAESRRELGMYIDLICVWKIPLAPLSLCVSLSLSFFLSLFFSGETTKTIPQTSRRRVKASCVESLPPFVLFVLLFCAVV